MVTFYCVFYTLYRDGVAAQRRGATGNGLRVILLLCPYYHHNVHATGRMRYAHSIHCRVAQRHAFYRKRDNMTRPNTIL